MRCDLDASECQQIAIHNLGSFEMSSRGNPHQQHQGARWPLTDPYLALSSFAWLRLARALSQVATGSKESPTMNSNLS